MQTATGGATASYKDKGLSPEGERETECLGREAEQV
jgi:hypothetical protein